MDENRTVRAEEIPTLIHEASERVDRALGEYYTCPDGSVIKSVGDVRAGDEFTLRTADGEIDGTVRATRKKKLSRSGQERR